MAGRRGTTEIPMFLRIPNIHGSRGVTSSGAPPGVPALDPKSRGRRVVGSDQVRRKPAPVPDSGQEVRRTQPGLSTCFLRLYWKGCGEDALAQRGRTRTGTWWHSRSNPGRSWGANEDAGERAPHGCRSPCSALCKLSVGRLALPVLHFRSRF